MKQTNAALSECVSERLFLFKFLLDELVTKSSTFFTTTTTRGHDYSLSMATPTTFLSRKQMQSLRHAPHRLGPQDRPGRRASIAVFSLRGGRLSGSRLLPPPTRRRHRIEPRFELLHLRKTCSNQQHLSIICVFLSNFCRVIDLFCLIILLPSYQSFVILSIFCRLIKLLLSTFYVIY